MKWSRATIQRGTDVEEFARDYLASPERQSVLICGAGFDPRTLRVPKMLAAHGVNASALCIREERPNAQPNLRARADKHVDELNKSLDSPRIVSLDIFDENASPVGGRRVISVIDQFIDGFETSLPLDIIVDISALSCSIFFPIFARLLGRAASESKEWNIHLLVAESPEADSRIRGEIVDAVSYIHGFRSTESLLQTLDHAILWIPVFAEERDAQMRLIHGTINQPASEVDISPVVPFPGSDPRRPDVLVELYRDLIGEWEIDTKHLIYAAEDDPLDSYRSIFNIDQLRQETYGALGGSTTIVSPLGSKMLSVGMMLAAIERNLRVMHVEYRGFEEAAAETAPQEADDGDWPLTHLWLYGESSK